MTVAAQHKQVIGGVDRTNFSVWRKTGNRLDVADFHMGLVTASLAVAVPTELFSGHTSTCPYGAEHVARFAFMVSCISKCYIRSTYGKRPAGEAAYLF